MGINKLLGREKTNPKTRGTYSAYVSGTYLLPYGKTTFKISGVGTPGNAPTGGNATGSYNPSTGGNTSYNPSTGGNYAGTNPPYIIFGAFEQDVTTTTYTGPVPTPIPTPYNLNGTFSNNVPNQVRNYSATTNVLYAVQTIIFYNQTGSSLPAGYYISNYNATAPSVYETFYVTYYANSTTPGTANYNPVVPGNAYTNPVIPGNATYNPVVPGNAGPTNTVLGVTFPGGAVNSPAPTVTPTYVNIQYTPAGTTVTVPTGGRVDIINS